jgi:lipoprotein-anchoring transpeptidase ErfK/SrfK
MSVFVLALTAILIESTVYCAQAQTGRAQPSGSGEYAIDEQPGAVPDSRDEQLPVQYKRQPVYYRTNEPAGTIIVDTADRYLYLIQGNNRAMRYGIGVGREGFQWEGLLHIARKAEWPDWVPPAEMIARQLFAPLHGRRTR